MAIPTQSLRVTIFALLGVGLVSAVVLGRGRATHTATIPAGTALVAALERDVSTEHSRPGDAVELRSVEPIRLGRENEIPAGVIVRGTVTEAKGGGRIAGAPQLAMRFTEIEVAGERHTISAEPFHVSGNNDAGKSAAQIGGGAVAGAILGRIVGREGRHGEGRRGGCGPRHRCRGRDRRGPDRAAGGTAAAHPHRCAGHRGVSTGHGPPQRFGPLTHPRIDGGHEAGDQ